MTREKPICPDCKGDSITINATAEWNHAGQYWEVCDAWGDLWCHDCDSEIHAEWVTEEAAA